MTSDTVENRFDKWFHWRSTSMHIWFCGHLIANVCPHKYLMLWHHPPVYQKTQHPWLWCGQRNSSGGCSCVVYSIPSSHFDWTNTTFVVFIVVVFVEIWYCICCCSNLSANSLSNYIVVLDAIPIYCAILSSNCSIHPRTKQLQHIIQSDLNHYCVVSRQFISFTEVVMGYIWLYRHLKYVSNSNS